MSESTPVAPSQEAKRGFFARIVLFVKQVLGELKKVVTPTRDELWTYFAVVIIFVIAVMAYVGVLDLLFTYLTRVIFG